MVVEMKPRLAAAERVKCVRMQLEQIRIMMTSPHAGSPLRYAELLSQAVQQMPPLERMDVSPQDRSAISADVAAIRSELRTISALIEQASRMNSEWSKLIGLHVNGYSRDGSARGHVPGGRVMVRA